MNLLKYNFFGNQEVSEKCRCGLEMTNIHLYECENLNSSIKKVPYTKLFNGRICEMKYLIEILNENQKKHEQFTQAQDIHLSSR